MTIDFIEPVAGGLVGLVKKYLKKNLASDYERRLYEIIGKTIDDYKRENRIEESDKKIPFYDSRVVFESLSEYVLFNNRKKAPTAEMFRQHSNIIPPTPEQIHSFYGQFLQYVREDEELKGFFIQENYQAQIYENAEQLQGLTDLNRSIKNDTSIIIEGIEEIRRSSGKKGYHSDLPKELSNFLPKRAITDLIGRDAQLEELRNRLADQRQVLVMNGMGGIGKTSLAAAYVHTYYDHYQHIIWVEATDSDLMQTMITTEGVLTSLQITPGNNLEETYHAIITKLKSLPGENLLVIDNATENVAEYRDILPTPPAWHLLITSRERIACFDIMSLDFLDKKDAVTLFNKYYQRKDLSKEYSESLVETLECHTLTIEILAKTADHFRLSEEQVRTALVDNRTADITTDHSKTKIERIGSYLAKTFTLSRLSEDEITLLRYLALLPNGELPFQHLTELLPFFARDVLAKTLNDLSQKGWIMENASQDTYKIHQIVAEIVRQRDAYKQDFVSSLQKQLENLLKIDIYDNPVDKFLWVPYGSSFLQHIESIKESSVSVLQNNLATTLKDLGEYEQARGLIQKAYTVFHTKLGEAHPNTQKVKENMKQIFTQVSP